MMHFKFIYEIINLQYINIFFLFLFTQYKTQEQLKVVNGGRKWKLFTQYFYVPVL